MTPAIIPLVRIIRCEHRDVLPGTVGVIVGLHGDGLAVAVTLGIRTVTVYVERDDVEAMPVPREPNGQAVMLPLQLPPPPAP